MLSYLIYQYKKDLEFYPKRFHFRLGAMGASWQECKIIHDYCKRALQQRLKLKREGYMKILMLNWADYIILGIVLISVLVSLLRGFVREALSLVTWVAAFWVAFTFYDVLAAMITKDIHSESVRTAVAFGSLFLITLILGALVNYLIGQLVDRTGLTGTDRVLGMLFGFARGILLIAILLLLARLTPMPNEDWWKHSVLITEFKPIETWLHDFLPQSLSDKFVPSY